MTGKEKTTWTRRAVLKIGVLVGAGLSLGLSGSRTVFGIKPVAAGAKATKEKKQLGFWFDQNKCIGCRNCEYACKKLNNWDMGVQWRRVLSAGRPYGKVYLSLSCSHCYQPACMEVCPVGAYEKREADGIVIHHAAKCVGCKYCLYACPYHAPQYSEASGTVSKCHFCYFLQDQGQNPACVDACPAFALKYGDMATIKSPDGVGKVGQMPDPDVTCPAFVIIPKGER